MNLIFNYRKNINKLNKLEPYFVTFSNNPQIENNSKKSINCFSYIFYKNQEINLNEGKQGEINKIKNSTKPFGNIKFNNRVVKNHGRNEISKGQYSMQKDQTDRGLLKSNL